MIKELLFSYFKIFLGLAIFSIGYTCFMLPYQIMSGGMAGVAALIYYATGFHAGYSYFIIKKPRKVSAKDMIGFGKRFHAPRPTEEWMKELREGEE